MSIRNQDPSIKDLLRSLATRLDRLEKGDKGVRVNDTRLGDTVVSSNPRTNQLEVRNLSNGYMTPIGSQRDIVWSWPGLATLDGDTNDSPASCIPDDMIAHEIVLVNPLGFGSICVRFNFPNNASIVTTLPLGHKVRVRPININLKKNDIVYVTLLDYTAPDDPDQPMNMSAILRFGQPSELADNTTIECEELVPM